MMRRALAACALASALAACNPQPPPPQPQPSGPSPTPSATPGAPASAAALPALIITGVGTRDRPVRIVQQTPDNRKQYELLARSYQSSGAQGAARAVFQDVHVTFFGKDGSTLTAQAPQAVLDESANTVTLQPRVRARSSSGITLVCDRLVYDRHTQMSTAKATSLSRTDGACARPGRRWTPT